MKRNSRIKKIVLASMGMAILLAFSLSFSSTVFAVKILEENGRINALNGRTAIGVLIIQDILAVIYLTVSTGRMPSWWAVLVIGLLPVARKVLLAVLNRVDHGELMVVFGLFVALIAGASTFEVVHLKPDLGALVVGMLMAPHPRAREMADALMSVKDIPLTSSRNSAQPLSVSGYARWYGRPCLRRWQRYRWPVVCLPGDYFLSISVQRAHGERSLRNHEAASSRPIFLDTEGRVTYIALLKSQLFYNVSRRRCYWGISHKHS